MLPLALGLAALFLLGKSGSAKKPPALPAPMPKLVIPGSTVVRTAPKSAPKTVKLKTGPARIPPAKKPKVTTTPSIATPLTSNPSQGTGPQLDTPLSADIPTDSLRTVPFTSLPPATPRPASTPRSHIPGFNPDAARRGAASIANHLKRSGKAKYDRRLLKQWQVHAGLTADGLYGPATRGALIYFGQKDPPAAFQGTGTTKYTP